MTMRGRFHDGISSKTHKVTVSLSSSYLIISAENRAFELRWLYTDMMVVAPWRLAVPGKLGNHNTPDARLNISDEKTWQKITAKLKAAQGPDRIPASWPALAGLSFATAAMLVLLFFSFPKILSGTAHLLPDSWMHSLGRRAALAMITDPVCTGNQGQSALEDLSGQLQSAGPGAHTYRVFIAEDDTINNAFTFPGGYIVLYSGLLNNAGSQEEIAGVLAHEMGHVVHGHAKKSLLRGLGLSLTARMVFGNEMVAEIAATLSSLRFNREEELEADRFAVKTLTEAGMSPAGLRAFFERLAENKAQEETEKLISFLATHPASADRIKNIPDSTENDTYRSALAPSEWQQLKNICAETLPLSEILE